MKALEKCPKCKTGKLYFHMIGFVQDREVTETVQLVCNNMQCLARFFVEQRNYCHRRSVRGSLETLQDLTKNSPYLEHKYGKLT